MENDKVIKISFKNKDGTESFYWMWWDKYLEELDYNEWGYRNREAYFNKYPHLKPEYESAKVTLDEADKIDKKK